MTVAPKPTSRMGYPFNAKDGKAFADVQDAYAGLALADGGHFPLGNNGHFHGGIHFDRGTANVFSTEEGVQCVADGEIVAYRIDEHYLDATPVADTPLEAGAEPFANADQGQEAQATAVLRPYSTGFVLVRHRLQAPPLPAPASDDDLASATVEPDYGTRLATRAHGPTVGWLPLYARVALMELQNGWAKVRIQPPSVATWTREPVAEPWLPLYSLDRLPTTLPNRWFGGEPPVATVVLGSQPKPQPPMCKPAAVISPPELVLYSLYMHLADGASYQATPDRTPKWWPKKRHRAGLKTKNQWTLNDQVIEGLTVRALDSSTELGILVRGSVIEIEPMAGNDKWGLVRRIVEGGIATQPDGVQITELPVPGRVYLEELDAFSAPAAFDNIEIPVPPIPLSMGEVIGHLGQQVSSSDTLLANQPASRPMLHLEIFSAEDVPRFLLDSRRYAENLPKQHWTLVRLRQGDPIKAEPRDDAPSVIDLATDWTTGITRHTTVQQDDHQQSWVNVQVLAADGSIVHGWAKDTDRRLTPWHWPGFDVVDAASNQAGTWWDGTASAFVDFLRGGQRPEETPFFKHIRQLMGLNNQGELSEENLDAALQNRALAKRLGGLIAYHTSEWHVPSWAGKYGVISEIAVKLGKWAMDNVKAEKNCVMKLRWWGEVAADVGLPEGAKVYHFHPVGLVGRLATPDAMVTYRIYQSTGLIERLVPVGLEAERMKDARYIYISSDSKEHDFGVFIGQKAVRWIKKGIAGTDFIYLMDVAQLGTNSAREFGFRFFGTDRRFLNQTALAALIGALMEVGYEDVASTGFSNVDGTPGISKSHINGENGDFKFMRFDGDWGASTHLNTIGGVNSLDEDRQNMFNKALFKFGWKVQFAWRYSKGGVQKLLSHTAHLEDHHHHLHVGNFSPNLKEVVQ